MRPKKKVLLIDSNEDSKSFLKVVLETHGYALTEIDPDVVVTRSVLHNFPKHVPVLMYTESRADFLAMLKAISKSPRGPKKGVARGNHLSAISRIAV